MLQDLMSLYNGPTFTVLAMLRIPSAFASTTHRTTQLGGQGMWNEAKRRPGNYLSLYNQSRAANSSVVKCPPLNWKVGCSIHGHWVTCRSAPWTRMFTSTALARSTIQASACCQLPSPKLTKKNQSRGTSHKDNTQTKIRSNSANVTAM